MNAHFSYGIELRKSYKYALEKKRDFLYQKAMISNFNCRFYFVYKNDFTDLFRFVTALNLDTNHRGWNSPPQCTLKKFSRLLFNLRNLVQNQVWFPCTARTVQYLTYTVSSNSAVLES